ncbi:MAG: ATP-binding protein [Rhodobiaceae bacterium]|nr:ATP-binding protein [Rhodobiaceae bacterium]MCC0055002.1 ATP-binding protein [Rhodobiaceae bacterium]
MAGKKSLKFEPPRPSAYTPFLRRFTDERARDLADTISLYERVTAKRRVTIWSRDNVLANVSKLAFRQIAEIVPLPTQAAIADSLIACQIEILALEHTIFVTPEIDWKAAVFTLQEQVDLRRFLRAQEYFLANEEHIADELVTTLTNLFAGIVSALPPLSDNAATGAQFTVPLFTIVADPHDLVDRIVGTLMKPHLAERGLFTTLQDTIYRNACNASGVPYDAEPKKPLIAPADSRLPPEALVEAYLGDTPLFDLLSAQVPFSLSEPIRFEHMHIVAGSGHGKTQTLQQLILHDLDAVATGRASIVVIDSQSDLINNIAGMKLFAPGQPLAERLVLIDPTDLEWPVALNLFDAGLDRLDQYSLLDRERLTNSILELYDFVLGSLLDAGMTQKQNVIFRYITRLLIRIPGATIHTLRELLEDGGSERYRTQISALSGSARAFFENEFDGKEFVSTKRQVLRRLYGILENQTFERMFSHPKSKLDLFSEMNAGKVILINTAKDLLKENGTEIFGRFFIAMIAQAAQERAVLPAQQRLPTFVYIDEANDYFDRNIGVILSQARKYNVGMVLAHQFLGQIDSKLHEAVAANTSIKFAGGVSSKDARALAADLRTDASFIEAQQKLSFAAFIKGQTKHAVSLRVRPGQMEQCERLTEQERQQQRNAMRGRYAVHYSELANDSEIAVERDPAADQPDDGKPMPW